jgi:adenylate kinase
MIMGVLVVNKVILLTGAPGTGKSTLRRGLAERVSGLHAFDYGSLLLLRKQREGAELSYEQLREKSAEIISSEDVHSTDDAVVAEITRLRSRSDIIIDSHALTRELFGFRAIPFSGQHLRQLDLSCILIIRCDPDILVARTNKAPEGRRSLTVELAREIQILQAALGLSYASTCGCPLFMIDSTSLSEDQVLEAAVGILAQIGCSVSF